MVGGETSPGVSLGMTSGDRCGGSLGSEGLSGFGCITSCGTPGSVALAWSTCLLHNGPFHSEGQWTCAALGP